MHMQTRFLLSGGLILYQKNMAQVKTGLGERRRVLFGSIMVLLQKSTLSEQKGTLHEHTRSQSEQQSTLAEECFAEGYLVDEYFVEE